MRTSPAAAAAILTALVAFSLNSAAAQMTRGEITLEKAREILQADPVGIPGYPVRFYSLSGHRVLVRQELEAGRVIQFAEDRDPSSIRTSTSRRPDWVSTRPNPLQEDGARRILGGYPSSIEEQYWARASYRSVGPVNVKYLGAPFGPPARELLDRLAPIQ